jgi:hypothetical protein
LRRPDPSFAASRSGGVESGGGSEAPEGEPSQADDRFDQLASELEQLVADHGDEIQAVERALTEAEERDQLESLREEARRRADAIRRAVEGLPQVGAHPGTARSAAALGREHAGAMAQNLERLSLADAVQSGKDALSSLAEAERKAKNSRGLGDWLDESATDEAKRRLEQELQWAQQQLDRVQRAAKQKRAAHSRNRRTARAGSRAVPAIWRGAAAKVNPHCRPRRSRRSNAPSSR